MNDTPDLPSSVPTPEPANLAQAFETLRKQFQTTLIVLIILSGAINLYLLRQFTVLRKEVATIEPQVTQLVADYQRVTVPLVNTFLKQLSDYAQTHPDFRPVLAKYNIQGAPTGAVPAAVVPPAKTAAPSPAPKK
jgi:hypothetical protein